MSFGGCDQQRGNTDPSACKDSKKTVAVADVGGEDGNQAKKRRRVNHAQRKKVGWNLGQPLT